MPFLSKSKIMAGLQCKKRLYLEVHHPELQEFSDFLGERTTVTRTWAAPARS